MIRLFQVLFFVLAGTIILLAQPPINSANETEAVPIIGIPAPITSAMPINPSIEWVRVNEVADTNQLASQHYESDSIIRMDIQFKYAIKTSFSSGYMRVWFDNGDGILLEEELSRIFKTEGVTEGTLESLFPSDDEFGNLIFLASLEKENLINPNLDAKDLLSFMLKVRTKPRKKKIAHGEPNQYPTPTCIDSLESILTFKLTSLSGSNEQLVIRRIQTDGLSFRPDFKVIEEMPSILASGHSAEYSLNFIDPLIERVTTIIPPKDSCFTIPILVHYEIVSEGKIIEKDTAHFTLKYCFCPEENIQASVEPSGEPPISTPSDIEGARIINEVNIAPNPNTGTLTIKYSLEEDARTHFELVNINGQKILGLAPEQQEYKGFNSREFDISSIPEGIYFILISIDESVSCYKIIKD